jgi:Tfp pilus assembly pilus retraction ATPase PilT
VPGLRAGELLEILSQKKARETFLIPGSPPILKIEKTFTPILNFKLTPDDVKQILVNLHSRSTVVNVPLREAGYFSFGIPGVGRFLVSYVTQRGSYAVYIQLVEQTIPPLKIWARDPEIFKIMEDSIETDFGLILITGPFYRLNIDLSASLLQEIISKKEVLVYTVEYPLTYSLQHRNALVIQREVGTDVPSFEEGLKESLRLPSEVVYINDIPGSTVAESLLRVVESGKLVIAILPSGGIQPGLFTFERFFDNPYSVRHLLAEFTHNIFSPYPETGGPALMWLEKNPEVNKLLLSGDYEPLSTFIRRSG